MEGAMWLVALVITATVSGESQEANSSSYLDAAMTGFDPLYVIGLKEPNPGRRAKLFQPLYTLNYYPNKTVLNSFVNEEQNRYYIPEITIEKIVNFKQYLEFTASSAYEFSSNTDCSAAFIRHVTYSSCTTKNHERDRAMLEFFRNTRGEVLFAKTDIVTHTITISSLEITTFTDAFQRAVETLYTAAVNSAPEVGEQIFNEFIRLYGTHFSRRTLLGSRAIFGKLFSIGAATDEEETDRRQCLLEAAREALTPCMRVCNETTQTVFERASSKRCGGEEHEAIVAVTGPLPERSLDDWASAAKDSPNPLFYELEPLSSLFTTAWFEDYFDSIQVGINGTKLSQYYKEKLSNNSRRMARERLDSPLLRGCGLSSDCRRGTECHNEPDTESGFSCVLREDEATTTTSTAASTGTKISTTTTPVPTTTNGGVLDAVVGRPQTLTSHPRFGSSEYENFYYSGRRIRTAPGFKVLVRLQTFQTESVDFLYIYDGARPTDNLLAKLSGTPTLNNTYTSSAQSMFLLFVTDESVTGSGYQLTYEAVA